MNNLDFIEYKVKKKLIDKVVGQTIKQELEVFIVRTTTNDDGLEITLPSTFTSFISDLGGSLNTRYIAAKYLCQFLNYIIIQSHENNEDFKDIKDQGFVSLNFTHAASFLKHCINELFNARDTAKAKERLILQFYDYLNTFEVINVPIQKETYLDSNGVPKEKILSPFNTYRYKVVYPEKIATSKKLKYMEPHILDLFMDCCDEICPEISLGVYIQTMGGLRLGEVVNCTLKSINIKKGTFSSIDVLDNQSNLFYNKDSLLHSCQVKKPRYNQVLINENNKLNRLYDKHIKLMNKRRTSNTPKEALFIDNKGLAMTGTYYQYKFLQVKDFFLEKLSTLSYSDYLEFRDRPWGTHIGRGIFTNYCIINGYCNNAEGIPCATILAKLRGDSNIYSSKDYIDSIATAKNRERKINTLTSSLEDGVKYN